MISRFSWISRVSRNPCFCRVCLHGRTRRACGFTLLELLLVVAIVAILASVAYPLFTAQIGKARRADALVALMAAQMAQERWRANQASYGSSLADIGAADVSDAGHYTLRITASSATGYEILATARGVQRQDAACRNLRLQVVGANFVYASGTDASVANSAAINRSCWSL